jgi:hypothetical protein
VVHNRVGRRHHLVRQLVDGRIERVRQSQWHPPSGKCAAILEGPLSAELLKVRLIPSARVAEQRPPDCGMHRAVVPSADR